MKILDYIKNNIVYLDGGTGTLLQQKGLMPGELPEQWNISKPEIIRDIHKAYFDAGSNIVCTNTFGANILKFTVEQLEKIIPAAVKNARDAAEQSNGDQLKFVALDIGPCGKLLKPYGDLDFEDAVSVFAETVRIGAKCGVDLIMLETFSDCYETKAALLAVKENCNLPVFVSNAYGEDGKLLTGASPSVMAAMLEGMGADAIGINCSLGPDRLSRVADEMLGACSLPVILKPNAGLPKSENGKTIYNISPEEFAQYMEELVSRGIRIVGGCCGTTPEYIEHLVSKTKNISARPVSGKTETVVTSYTKAVRFGKKPVLIGERINPTGKKRLKQALIENDITYILTEGLEQQECGVHILDVNAGIPDIDEKEMLPRIICSLQEVSDLPLQIDTASQEAMEKALRRYNGKALINSVNGKKESMDAIFPLIKKYGGVAVALTLDENGIPDSAEGRIEIAKKILTRAKEYGIDKKDIIFDTLAMTVSADINSPRITLDALGYIHDKLGCHTSLGVSNVSYGLPSRDSVNSTFFALALQKGLSAAIMNPYSEGMMKAYHAYLALSGLDENCSDYISYVSSLPETIPAPVAAHTVKGTVETGLSPLAKAISSGIRQTSYTETKKLLDNMLPTDIINTEIIPALDSVGKAYENKTAYLPQLLTSAEAAKSAFEAIKEKMIAEKMQTEPKGEFVIATVHGDIHDIGKNIVRLLLENYGFTVHDLGKDVPPEKVLEKVLETGAKLVGLSALMTTTVPAMEETIKLLREKAPFCRIIVGGAVLTKEYAEKIGADHYAKDAMEAVRYAESNI